MYLKGSESELVVHHSFLNWVQCT